MRSFFGDAPHTNFRFPEEEPCGFTQGVLTLAGLAALYAGIYVLSRAFTTSTSQPEQEEGKI